MKRTLRGFCCQLMDEDPLRQALEPELTAAAFVDYFQLSARPTLEELKALVRRAGLGTVEEGKMEGMRGAHIGQPGGQYHIYHRDDLWEGSKRQTVLHELFEITLENMSEIHSPGMPSPSGPDPRVCRQAERFAAAALMQPDIFAACAQASGLDVAALHDLFGCSYVSVSLRLAEVVRDPPMMAVLYEHRERGDPAEWPAPTKLGDLTARVVKRTAGFAPTGSPLLCGARRGIPYKGRSLPSGSLAELAARSGRPEYAEGDGIAVVAAPVVWKGRLAKVIVVAVPLRCRDVLLSQRWNCA